MIAWLLLALMSLMLAFRFLTRFFLKSTRPFELEEVLLLFAYLFSVGAFVTIVVPQGAIFGKQLSDISAPELRAGLEAGFAGDLLYFLSLGLAKLSICACYLALSADHSFRRTTQALGLFIILWTLVSFLGSAFRCGLNGPWDESTHCADQQAFLSFVGITNILTDVGLIVLAVVLFWPTSFPLQTRLMIILLFGTRSLFVHHALHP
ncbi:hypothetical protein GQ53DRAFT_812119 [Thozetella sp. PMI_491]|nr:hypothetical protein GQ53DRAFT_812119 [Thozetella sp. PMI_491]